MKKQPLLFFFLLAPFVLFAQDGTVSSEDKVSDLSGSFDHPLANQDYFAKDICPIGDLDGDGVTDFAVGADGYSSQGGVFILFMNSDGTVKHDTLIASGLGGFTGTLSNGDDFGYAVTNLGDVDGDSITDIAVGAEEDEDGGSFRVGAVWILFLNTDGTVKNQQKISAVAGGFTGDLDNGDRFGSDVEGLGDWDGDGIPDLAVGALFDDDGGGTTGNQGAVWILYLNSSGTVKSHDKIGAGSFPLSLALDEGDYFGAGIGAIGDLDGDGNADLAVGAELDDDGASDAGAVYILFLDSTKSVSSYQKISSTAGGMPFGIGGSDFFGCSVSPLGDVDGDDVMDIAVGMNGDNSFRGVAWTIMLNTSGTVKSAVKITTGFGGFGTTLDFLDAFGNNVHGIGDFDGDAIVDMVVTAPYDDDGGSDRGAFYILNLDGVPGCASAGISPSSTDICIPSTVSFTNASAAATSYQWFKDDSLISTSTDTAWTFSSPGSYEIKLVADNGSCFDTAIVNIVASESPSLAAAGMDQLLCEDSTSISATNPSIGTGMWSLFSGTATISSPGSTTASITGIGTGDNVLLWTVSNGACTPSIDSLIIHADAPPSPVEAGPDTAICDTSIALYADNLSIGSGSWSIISGGGTVTSPTDPASMLNGLPFGFTNLEWRASNGVCPDIADTVTIRRDQEPSPVFAGADSSICDSNLSLYASPLTLGTGSWSILSGGGSIASPSDHASSFDGIPVGTTSLRWGAVNGVCPAIYDTVNINRDDFPSVADAGADSTICDTSIALAANIPSVGTGMWAVVFGGSSLDDPFDSFSEAFSLDVGSNVLEWSVTNGVCPPSTDTTIITREENPSPAIILSADTAICDTSIAAFANPISVGTASWSLISGTGSIISPSSPATNIFSIGAGVNAFLWESINGSCPPSRDTLVIQRDLPPSVAAAMGDTLICDDFITLSAVAPSMGTGSWSVVSGSAVFSDPDSSLTNATSIAPGLNSYSWSVENGACPASIDTVSITRGITPTLTLSPPTISLDTAFFSGSASGADSLTLDFGDGSPVVHSLDTFHVYPAVGSYTACATAWDSYGCEIISCASIMIIITDQEADIFNGTSWNIWPNPTSGIVRIQSSSQSPVPVNVSLFDMEGKLVLETQISPDQIGILDLSQFAGGIYHLRIDDPDGVIHRKVLRF